MDESRSGLFSTFILRMFQLLLFNSVTPVPSCEIGVRRVAIANFTTSISICPSRISKLCTTSIYICSYVYLCIYLHIYVPFVYLYFCTSQSEDINYVVEVPPSQQVATGRQEDIACRHLSRLVAYK